jgi:hypothetical protein
VFVWATREPGIPFSALRVDGICKPSALKIGDLTNGDFDRIAAEAACR